MKTFLRLRRVIEVTGLGRSTLYSLVGSGRFPKPINLTGGRSVAWLSDDVDAWITTRVEQSRTAKNLKVATPDVHRDSDSSGPPVPESRRTTRFGSPALRLGQVSRRENRFRQAPEPCS